MARSAFDTFTYTPPRRGRKLASAAAGGGGGGGGGGHRRRHVKPPAAPPMTLAEKAQAEIDPVIAAITGATNQRAAAAEAAIKGLTDEYAKKLGGIDYAAPYAGAEAGQAAVDAALRDSLTGGGADLASGLSARLKALEGSSGEAAVNEAAKGIASQGRSAGTTQLAEGSAALSNLLADAAAAGSYGKKMPGIADLAGVQGLKQVEGNAQQEIAQATEQEEAKLPDIIQSLRSDALQAKQLKETQRYHRDEEALAAVKAQAAIAQGNARIGISRQNANTSAYRAQVQAAHDAHEERMAELNYGVSVEKLRNAERKAQHARKSGGVTPYQLSEMRANAAKELQTYYHGVPAKYQIGPDGQRVLVAGTGPGSAKTYQQTIKNLILSYPALGPKQIINMANRLFKPGEGGRPMRKQPKIAAILSGTPVGPGGGRPFAGSPTKAKPYKGHFSYLGPTQGVKAGLLNNIALAARTVGATKIRITSGYRSPSHNASVGGVAHSNHMTGDAIDGYAYIPGRGWVPLGVALLPVAFKFGLRSGDVPGFFHGGPDLVHVDDGANVR